MWSGEDDPADTLIPRLLAMGADVRRIHFVGSVNDMHGRRAFDPATDVRMWPIGSASAATWDC